MSTYSAAVERRPAVLGTALGVATLAAVLLALGSVLPVVTGGDPGFTSAPLLVVLAFVPVALATLFVVRGRHATAAGVLAGFAALAPGRAVLEWQFVADPSATVRPELYLPTDLVEHSAAAGLWLLLAGHVAAVVAGVLAVRVVRAPEPGSVPEGQDSLDRWRQRWLLVALLAAIVTAVGLLMAPVVSTDVYLLARNAFEGPAVALAGYLLIACALPLAVALVMTAGSGEFAQGCLAGLAVAVAGLALPSLVAGASVAVAGVSAGPVVAVVGAAGLLALAGTRLDLRPAVEQPDDQAGTAHVPGRRRLELTTGVLAVLTAAAALVGSVTPQVSSTGAGPAPDSPTRWLLVAAGLLVGLLGVAMAVRAAARVLRPVLSVAWVAVLIAGTAVLDTAITATSVRGVLSSGPGVVWVWLAMCGAVVTACSSAVTGVVEREDAGDIDGTQSGTGGHSPVDLNLLVPAATAAILSVAAFGLPAVTAAGYVPPGLWSEFRTPSWGLLAGALTVVGVVALALRSRPAPAAGLLVGAACLLGLHAAAVPLSSGHLDGAEPGTGTWVALVAVTALLTSAAIALAGSRSRRGGA